MFIDTAAYEMTEAPEERNVPSDKQVGSGHSAPSGAKNLIKTRGLQTFRPSGTALTSTSV
jgi:hypothetical protein